jgi:AraC-like DNA-binding protein
MPLYMDQHILPGVKARDVAEAHRLDMMVQGEHGCQCMTYWVDEKRGNVFCLIEAPDMASVSAMHQQAHGLVPNKVIEVDEALVESFLGRIADPSEVSLNDNGLKVFEESSLRIILMVKLLDPLLVQYAQGETGIINWQQKLQQFREIITQQNGREVDYGGNFLVASFHSVKAAMSAASSIREKQNDSMVPGDDESIALQAGEPVSDNSKLFGEVTEILSRCCILNSAGRIVVAEKAADLLSKEKITDQKNQLFVLNAEEEKFISLLFESIDKNWHQAAFNMDSCCRLLAMSTSQLYRKTVKVCGLSPNNLLRSIRLQRSKGLLSNKIHNISQVSFEAGFSSPSYFSKCFKEQYGLLPQAYQQLTALALQSD